MKALKTYDKVSPEKDNLSFRISKMEDIYEQRNAAVDEPHRHNYYTVILTKHAKGLHKIDFNSYALKPKQLYFVSPGQVHQLIEEEKSFGFAMTFATQFLVENQIRLSFIENLNLFNDYGQSPPLEPNETQFNLIESYVQEIHRLFHSKDAMKELSIGAFLKLVLIQANNICTLNPIESPSTNSKNRILHNFKQLVNKHFEKEHSTSYYAQQLQVSPDHLNRLVKAAIGKTAKEYIQSRITTEAKRLLFFSSLNNKEIAYQLGFNEPANFSAFFKKCTGYSPSNFLKKETEKAE